LGLTQVSLPTLNWIEFPELVPVWPLEDVLAGAAGAGFRSIGLDDLTVAGRDPDDVAALLRSHGLACTDVGVLRVGEGDVREAAAGLAALAGAAGAAICIAAVYTATPDEVIPDLRTGAAILAESGVRAALEFVPYGGLPTLSDAIAVCDAVGWGRCGLLVDTWHFFNSSEPWELLRSLDPGQIALVHINDALPLASDDLVRESRFRRAPLGAGTFELAKFAKALEELRYEGVVSIEVLSGDLRSRPPAQGAQELLDSVRAGWPGQAVRSML
jgi:sugar phosphate isomerase/epimerase